MDTKCATEDNLSECADEVRPDAALPFLSFAAGLMTAIECAKLQLAGYPFGVNRAYFQPLSEDMVMDLPAMSRSTCLCADRSRTVHRRAIEGGRFEGLWGKANRFSSGEPNGKEHR